jgi:hypothetical protein
MPDSAHGGVAEAAALGHGPGTPVSGIPGASLPASPSPPPPPSRRPPCAAPASGARQCSVVVRDQRALHGASMSQSWPTIDRDRAAFHLRTGLAGLLPRRMDGARCSRCKRRSQWPRPLGKPVSRVSRCIRGSGRYDACRLDALADRSRCPHFSPAPLPAETEVLICLLRQAYPRWMRVGMYAVVEVGCQGVPSEVLTDNGKQFTGRFTKPLDAESSSRGSGERTASSPS